MKAWHENVITASCVNYSSPRFAFPSLRSSTDVSLYLVHMNCINLKLLTEILTAIFYFWRMWTSGLLKNVPNLWFFNVIFLTNWLVHIHQKEKATMEICSKNRSCKRFLIDQLLHTNDNWPVKIESYYSACRRRGGVLNSPRFCFFFFFLFFFGVRSRCSAHGWYRWHKPREPT